MTLPIDLTIYDSFFFLNIKKLLFYMQYLGRRERVGDKMGPENSSLIGLVFTFVRHLLPRGPGGEKDGTFSTVTWT
jgi:hypothetical protein